MSYDKADFVLMKVPAGKDVIVNIPQIKFVIEFEDCCRLYFNGGEDDFVMVEGTIEDIMEVL